MVSEQHVFFALLSLTARENLKMIHLSLVSYEIVLRKNKKAPVEIIGVKTSINAQLNPN